MAKARVRVSGDLANLLRSDWEQIISQANLGREDTIIAQRYLLDAIPQIDIAIELGLERSTISRRMPRILDRVQRTASKLNIC